MFVFGCSDINIGIVFVWLSDVRSLAPVFIGHFLRSTFWLSHARSLAHLACLLLDARMCDYWIFCPFECLAVGRSVAGTFDCSDLRSFERFAVNRALQHLKCLLSDARSLASVVLGHFVQSSFWFSDARSLAHMTCLFLDARTCDY